MNFVEASLDPEPVDGMTGGGSEGPFGEEEVIGSGNNGQWNGGGEAIAKEALGQQQKPQMEFIRKFSWERRPTDERGGGVQQQANSRAFGTAIGQGIRRVEPPTRGGRQKTTEQEVFFSYLDFRN